MITLRAVPGFGSFPDGRLRAGPFNAADPASLHKIMSDYGIYPGFRGDRAMVSYSPLGLMLSASGPGVRGYLLDDDQSEAFCWDVDELLLVCVQSNVPFRVSGHWCPDRDKMIISEATAIHDGENVEWTSSRMIQHKDGRIQPIGDPKGRGVIPALRAV